MSKNPGSLLEVAKRCSVSQSTVSRVLNNSKQGRFSVSAEVRERIVRVAEELNYRPSMAARNLAASRTKLVAVLGVGGFWSDRVGPGEVAVGAMAQVLDASGYEICMQFLSSRHGPFMPPPLRVDGVVTVSATRLEDLQALENSGLPYVSINGLVGPRGSQVSPDDSRGSRIALQHLVDLGHRRIAYLDHPSVGANHPSVFERRQAFDAVAAQLGVEVPTGGPPLLPALVPWDAYYEPFLREMILRQKATAVLCYSHHGALSLMRTAFELGLSIPKDFSIVCFNNEPVVRLTVPSLTAVDVPSVKMGQVAAELMLRHLAAEGELAPVRVRLEETLVARESSAPPGGRPQGV